MKPHNFDSELLTRPHSIQWCADIFAPSGDMIELVPIESGSVTLTGRDRSRTRGDLTLIDVEGVWDPDGFTGASPYGGHLQMCAQVFGENIYIAGGLILEVAHQRPEGTVRVAFVDYGVQAGWDLFFGPWNFAGTEAMAPTIEFLMEECASTATVIDPGVPGTLAGAFVEEQSRESAVGHICNDSDIVCWMDEFRRIRLQPEPVSATTPAVYTLRDGPTGTVTREAQTLSRDGVPSYVIVSGERPQGGGNPVWSLAFQASGPTNVEGPFGRVIQIANRPVLTTSDACLAAARTILAQQSRLVRDLRLSAVTHPALEPGDRVDVILEDRGMPMVIEEIRFAMGVDAMEVSVVEAQP